MINKLNIEKIFDYLDNTSVVFYEKKKMPYLEGLNESINFLLDDEFEEEYEDDHLVEIGKAKILREGSDITIIGFSLVLKYALEAAEELEKIGISAEVIEKAVKAPSTFAMETELHKYPVALKDRLGSYYTLGRVFVKLIGNPQIMQVATKYGMASKPLMRFTLKLLANLYSTTGKTKSDRIITALTKIAPAA